MSTFLICAALLAVSPPGETASPTVASPAATAQKPVALRTGPELREAVRAALRRWAKPSDTEADAAAKEFITLYGELERDDQLARAQKEQLRGKVRGRLLRLADQITKRVLRERRLAKKARAENVAVPAGKADPLAQQFGGQPHFIGPGFGGQRFAGQQGFGGQRGFGGQQGFGGGMQGGAFGAAGNDDHGPDLVELIKKVIAPNTWEDVGGNGTIFYWQPGRAMVVRQTAENHEALADMLEQLGRAGR